MKKNEKKERMVFADPTHKRLFIFSVIVLLFVLTYTYLKMYDPNRLLVIRLELLSWRFAVVHVYNRVFMALLVVNFIKLFVYAFSARKAKPAAQDFRPYVTAVIPAYNEEKTIVDTVNSVLRSDYKRFNVIVVDDGSADKTYEILQKKFGDDPRVTVITQPNGGKSRALNNGIGQAKGELLLLIDADTMIAKNAISLLVPHFKDPRVAAVSGNTRVGNVKNLITRFQRVEYIRDFNLIKNGMARFGAMAVVPGALGMWRKSDVLACGGFSTDTLGEDRDLTMALMKNGRKVEFEPMSFSETEAPHNLKNFIRQRFRWTYATLQCIRKYIGCTFNPKKKGLGLLLMPDLLIFQTILPLVTTVGFVGNLLYFDKYEFHLVVISYCTSVVIEAFLFLLAKRITGEKIYALDFLSVLPQRIIYGVVCTFLLFKAVLYAFIGTTVLWNKVERKGKEQSRPEDNEP